MVLNSILKKQLTRVPPTRGSSTGRPLDLGRLSIYTAFIIWTFINCSLSIVGATYDVDSSLNANNENRCNRTVDMYRTVTEPAVTEETRGKEMHCNYRVRIRPPRDDWIVFLRFTRLKVGEVSPDRSECSGGFIQIIDGNKDSNISKRTNPGFFCGEIDMPKTFISETPHVKVVFHSDAYLPEESYFQFDVSVQRQNEFYQRFGGNHHQLHPNRRGQMVAGSYCDRVFEDCSPGHCYIQSPGFPEVYPRNLRCRYLVKSKKSLIGLEVIHLDVDGQECDSLLMCFPRPVTLKPEECPHDYLRVYDGPDDHSPVIATLCGRGNRLPSNIIASGPEMLVELVTSPAGHLINTGFQLKAENIFESGDHQPIEIKPDGTCLIKRELLEANTSNLFTNMRSWYPRETSCSYKFMASHPSDRISLHFLWFRIDRVTLCEESLRLYDGYEPLPTKLMNRLCDTNKPMGGASKATYITSGPGLLIVFTSSSGSLAGSSLNYGFDVRRVVPEKKEDAGEIGRNCSHVLTPESLASASVTLHPETFNRSISGPVTCNITFSALPYIHGRVNVSILSSFGSSLTCDKFCDNSVTRSYQGRIVVQRSVDATQRVAPLCFCEPIVSPFSSVQPQVINVVSNSSLMTLSIHLPPDWGKKSESTPIQVMYRFFSEKRCGPRETLTSQLQGVLRFPFDSHPDATPDKSQVQLNKSSSPHLPSPASASFPALLLPLHMSAFDPPAPGNEPRKALREPLFCEWRLPVFPDLDVAFNVNHLNLPSSCSTDFLLLKDVPICFPGSSASASAPASPTSSPLSSASSTGTRSPSYRHHSQRHSMTDEHKYQGNVIIKKDDVTEIIDGFESQLSWPSDESFLRDRDTEPFPVSSGYPTKVSHFVTIYFSATDPQNSSFTLLWTQLKLLPETVASAESLLSVTRECEFLCKSSRACLRRDLVCNGFPNCPSSGASGFQPEDESEEACRRANFLSTLFTNKVLLILIGVCGFVVFVWLLIFVSLHLFTDFGKKKERFS